ncbi:MAG: CFI-box-CTERM domain-containing protein [Candidatus Woesearchaeota archaeon]
MDDKELKDILRKMGIEDTDGSYRIDPETGIVQKLGLFGWHNTEFCIDPKTGIVQKLGLFGCYNTEFCIDPKTGIVQKLGLFGCYNTEFCIDPKTGIVQKQGSFGWHNTKFRIDKDTGRVEEGCIITTACIKAMGLPDDCSELKAFRTFRDTYVRSLPNGDALISEYYTIAPRIIKAINREANAQEIYEQLYKQLVLRTVELISAGNYKEAFDNCFTIITDLKQKYLDRPQ